MLRQLETKRFSKPQSPFAAGPAPFLDWIETKKLVVDSTYQREIGKRGAGNVRQIAENFDWSKFAPVIVAPVEGGQFAIVDGQHRTTAAMLRGQDKVPCQVVQADRAKQAAAYAAVNGNVTKTTPQQLFHAKLAANDPKASAVQEACLAGDVEIVRRNLLLAQMKPGQTQAVAAITRCLDLYGRDTLVTSLQCITRTADGNASFVRATIVEAICLVLHENPAWREGGEALLRVMDKFSFPDAWEKVAGGRDQIFPSTAVKVFADLVRKHLSRKLVVETRQKAA